MEKEKIRIQSCCLINTYKIHSCKDQFPSCQLPYPLWLMNAPYLPPASPFVFRACSCILEPRPQSYTWLSCFLSFAWLNKVYYQFITISCLFALSSPPLSIFSLESLFWWRKNKKELWETWESNIIKQNENYPKEKSQNRCIKCSAEFISSLWVVWVPRQRDKKKILLERLVNFIITIFLEYVQ